MRIMICAALLLAACQDAPIATEVSPPGTSETASGSAGGWDARIMELMPFIDACLSKSPDTRSVTYAGSTGEALMIVRLSGAEAAVDCTLPEDDPNPAYAIVSPRREDLLIAGEHDAVFVRAPGANPGGECYDAPEVRGADGELLGWIADPQGC